jgi:prevent-host-death family protein
MAYNGVVTESITVRDARTHLAELITSAESGTPTVITRNGTPAAVLVPVADYQALEDAADIILAREAAAVLREEGEGRRCSLAEVIADVFAERTDAA